MSPKYGPCPHPDLTLSKTNNSFSITAPTTPVLSSSDDEEVIKRRQEAKLVADLVEGTKKKSRRHKSKKSKHKRWVGGCGLETRLCDITRSCNRKRKKSSSESGSEDEDEEGAWVEKTVKQDGQDVFVGPVPEIKVQATVTKKE